MEHTGPLVSQVLAPQRGYALQSGKEYDSRYLAHVSSRAPMCEHKKPPLVKAGVGLGEGDDYLEGASFRCRWSEAGHDRRSPH